ncbi:MAG: hypothetical protein IMY71_09990 [Bacteroidetes bacterium]|nr:hypothetical protein [Bacteroidota bacterium]
MQKLNFFDCNCSVGRVAYPHLYDIPDVEGLLKEMETAGIEEALVYHIVARDGYPPLGNSMLMEEIKNIPELHPVWVVLPHHTGEMPHPDNLLQEIKKNNVKAVRIYPKVNYHSFSISEWCSGELLCGLEEERIPLILDMETVSWEDVYTILGNHKQLPVIAATCNYRNNRYIYPLLEKFNNLFIELSRFMGAGAIEDIVKRFGSHHLIFGTNMPQYSGTAAVSILTYSDIDQEAKQDIAGKNLSKLLNGMWK